MGTMSRFQGRKTTKLMKGSKFPRSTLANRVLSGQTVRDVLSVINSPKTFSRDARRLTFALFRRHARALDLSIMGAHARYKGVVIQNDSAAGVQFRMLAMMRKLGSEGPGLVRAGGPAFHAWAGDGEPSHVMPAKQHKRVR